MTTRWGSGRQFQLPFIQNPQDVTINTIKTKTGRAHSRLEVPRSYWKKN